VGAVKIDVKIDATDICIPQSKCLSVIGDELERTLGVLANAVEGGGEFGERGGELDVLVFEDEKGGGGVKDDRLCRFAGNGEAEWGGVVEAEDEV
jgi:hypothetical protein